MNPEIILNPYAGNKRTLKLQTRIIERLKWRWPILNIHETKQPGDAKHITQDLLAAFPEAAKTGQLQIIVIGGDGTVHDAINGLQQAGFVQVPIGYIPTGTGNDFARGYHIPTDPFAAIESLFQSEPTPVPVGKLTAIGRGTMYFINSIGIGVDAQIVYETNASTAKSSLNRLGLGQLSYASNILSAIAHAKPFAITATTTHDVSSPNAFLFTIMNHPYLGGGIRLLPVGWQHEGHLNLVTVNRESNTILLQIVRRILMKKSPHRAMHVEAMPTIDFSTDDHVYVEIDGETFGTPLTATVSQTRQAVLLPVSTPQK